MGEQHLRMVRSGFFWAAVAAWCVGLAVYLYNIDGWLIADDEGTDLYEVWRIDEGDVPGEDLITEQPPFFLLAGLAVGRASGFDVAALRGVSAALVLGSAWLLFLLGCRVWGLRAGFLGMVIYLLNHMVFEQARLFRPDSWMLAFSVMGVYLFVLAQMRLQRRFLVLSGLAYGIAVLCKLFGILPLGGCVLFLGFQWLAGRISFHRLLMDGGALLVPFVLLSVGGMLAFYPPGSVYYHAVLGQHWQLGQQMGLLYRLQKGLVFLAAFLVQNAAFLFALPLLHRLIGSRRPGESVLAWQVPTGLAYLALSRPLYERYWLYLVPVLSLVVGHLIDRLLGWIRSRVGERGKAVVFLSGVFLAALAVAQSIPGILQQARRQEDGTLALAAFIAARTEPEDVVLSDYATLNFHARRPSIPQASVIAGGRIEGGFITGAMLIEEMRVRDVDMVVLHVSGGSPAPHHLVNLRDYEEFYAYLNQHFCLVTTFDRAGQILEIYQTCMSSSRHSGGCGCSWRCTGPVGWSWPPAGCSSG